MGKKIIAIYFPASGEDVSVIHVNNKQYCANSIEIEDHPAWGKCFSVHMNDGRRFDYNPNTVEGVEWE